MQFPRTFSLQTRRFPGSWPKDRTGMDERAWGWLHCCWTSLEFLNVYLPWSVHHDETTSLVAPAELTLALLYLMVICRCKIAVVMCIASLLTCSLTKSHYSCYTPNNHCLMVSLSSFSLHVSAFMMSVFYFTVLLLISLEEIAYQAYHVWSRHLCQNLLFIYSTVHVLTRQETGNICSALRSSLWI